MATFRIGSYNVENLFDRPRAMNESTIDEGSDILAAHAKLNELIQRETYTAATKTKMLALLTTLGLLDSDSAKYAVLRQVRERLVKRSQTTGVSIVANGRTDWIGWVDLTRERVNRVAMSNTARVISEIDADVLGVIEAESRVALKHFTDAGLVDTGNDPLYPHVMVIDGNDDRGIDVGLLTHPGFEIGELRSHVDDVDATGRVFSRDCPEFEVALPSGETLVVLVNHLKSKGYGGQAANDALRERQATRVAEIYQARRAAGDDLVVVLGDLNDTPTRPPLQPLLTTDLRDITDHPSFTADGRPGTYANGTASQKIDYLLLSPALWARVTGGMIFRKGVWGGVNGTLFPHFDTITRAVEAGSDHAAIYADISL